MPLKKSILGTIISIVVASLVSLAVSQNSIDFFGIPFLLFCVLYSYAIHWIFFIHAYIAQTEHYFDAIGSITFISLSVIVISYMQNFYSILIGALVSIWTLRLGTFLFKRIKKSGRDTRFTEMKKNFFWFFMTWNISALWVFLCYVAGLVAMTNKNSSEVNSENIIFIVIGVIFWVLGFSIEVISDYQKKVFREDINNKDKFISHGLWAWSRHPNYFGEIILWTGITIIALPVFKGWDYIALISPLFVYFLLVNVSGIPMLEKSADEKWGDDPQYSDYKDKTSILFLKSPKD